MTRLLTKGFWIGFAVAFILGLILRAAMYDRCEQSTTYDQFLACREQGPR